MMLTACNCIHSAKYAQQLGNYPSYQKTTRTTLDVDQSRRRFDPKKEEKKK